MANSKKITFFNGSEAIVSVPTSIDDILVREIASQAFTSTVEMVKVDAHKDDISGANWGAREVVWLKEPTGYISFDANGGYGTMASRIMNLSTSTQIPDCAFSNSVSFMYWAIGSLGGSATYPGYYEAFPTSTTLYAKWDGPEWLDNDCTSEEAAAQGWVWENSKITGFSGPIYSHSTYNIPRTIDSVSMTTVTNLSSNYFDYIGGKGIKTIDNYAFMNCQALLTVSFPACENIGISAFYNCTNLNDVLSFPKCQQINDYAFRGCGALQVVYLTSTTMVQGGNLMFDGCSALQAIYVNDLLFESYKVAPYWSQYSSYIAPCSTTTFT